MSAPATALLMLRTRQHAIAAFPRVHGTSQALFAMLTLNPQRNASARTSLTLPRSIDLSPLRRTFLPTSLAERPVAAERFAPAKTSSALAHGRMFSLATQLQLANTRLPQVSAVSPTPLLLPLAFPSPLLLRPSTLRNIKTLPEAPLLQLS